MEGELGRIVANGGHPERAAARAADAIRRAGGYRWAGVYGVGERAIEILGWSGPGASQRTGLSGDGGLCGAAVSSREAVVVGDVTPAPRYLTTDGTTRSEIVVPVLEDGRVVGRVDVESQRQNAFGQADRWRLERAAALFARLWRVGS